MGRILFNCVRSEGAYPKPISFIYMLVMWFSGLRGGVAFALASVSYAAKDFPQHCGGLSAEAAAAAGDRCALDDSTAMLQTTIMIAAFTIFVFGGAITDVAKASGILQDTSKEGTCHRAPKRDCNSQAWPPLHRFLVVPSICSLLALDPSPAHLAPCS